jgi:hypothetical protein
MYPVVIRSAVHAATRCALAITILLPEFKLENIACEEGKKRGSLQLAAQWDGTTMRIANMPGRKNLFC